MHKKQVQDIMWARRIHLLELPGFNLLHFSKWPIFWRVFGKNLEKHHNLLPHVQEMIDTSTVPFLLTPRATQIPTHSWDQQMTLRGNVTGLFKHCFAQLINHHESHQWHSMTIISHHPLKPCVFCATLTVCWTSFTRHVAGVPTWNDLWDR